MEKIYQSNKNLKTNASHHCVTLEDYRQTKDSRNMADTQAGVYSKLIIQKINQSSCQKH